MFTFQAPPPFARTDIVDVSDANITDFTSIYHSKKYANRYTSSTQPLHYADDQLLLRKGDIVLHLIEREGRVRYIEAARVWDTIYFDDESPIGAVLVSAQDTAHKTFSDFYTFSKLDKQGKEHVYFRNQHTLNQKQIRLQIDLLSRAEPSGEVWLPEKKQIVNQFPRQLLIQYPQSARVSTDFLHSAVVRYAKMGNPACLFAVAFWFREQGKFQQAIHGLQKAAERNFPAAWLELGLEYLAGQILEYNPEKATTCFRQAAYGGSPLASYHLALSYINGTGIEQSPTLALRHLQRAMEGGILAANLTLALYHRTGSFKHVQSLGNPKYKQFFNQNAINHTQAASLFFKAADKPWSGVALATFYLAEYYRTGTGVLLDKDYALELYKQSIEYGDLKQEEIQYAAFYAGDVERLTQCAEQDNPLSAYLLGRMYWQGESVPKNLSTAKRYLNYAAESAHSCAHDASQLLSYIREYAGRGQSRQFY